MAPRSLSPSAETVAIAALLTQFPCGSLSFREFPPLAFSAVRFGLSSICILLVLQRSEGTIRVPRGAWAPLTILGVIGNSAYQFLFMLGLARTTATNSSLVLASMPALVAALGAASGTEQLSRNG